MSGIVDRYQESHELSELHNFFALEPDEQIQNKILMRAAWMVNTLPEILEILEPIKSASVFPRALGSAVGRESWTLDEKVSILQAHLTPSDYQESLSFFFNNTVQSSAEVISWLNEQPNDEFKDPALSAYSLHLVKRRKFLQAYELAQTIERQETQSSIIASLSKAWVERNPDAASRHLPTEIIDQIQP